MYMYIIYAIWIAIAIGSAWHIYANTKKDRGLWTILGLLTGIIGWLIWRLAGPGAK